MSDYSAYFQHNTLSLLDTNISMQYNVFPSFDTFYIRKETFNTREKFDFRELINDGLDTVQWNPDRIILFPKHIYQLENAVRAVQHARSYLRVGAFHHTLWNILLVLPFYTILFASIPYLLLRMIFWALIGGISVGLLSRSLLEFFIDNSYVLNGYAYLTLPILSLAILLMLVFLQKHDNLIYFIFNVLIVGVAGILLFTFFIDDGGNINKPVNLAFFGVQVIGLAGLLLMAYLQAQPKSS